MRYIAFVGNNIFQLLDVMALPTWVGVSATFRNTRRYGLFSRPSFSTCKEFPPLDKVFFVCVIGAKKNCFSFGFLGIFCI